MWDAKAVGMAPACQMAPINYWQVVMAWLADLLIIGTEVTWTDFLGTFLILFFTIISTLQKAGLLCCCKSAEKQVDK